MRILLRPTAVAIAVAIPLSLAAAQPAAAVTGYRTTTQYIGGGAAVNVRSQPSTSSPVLQSMPVQTAIDIQCQVVGTRLGFSQYSENRTWDRLVDGRYVHDVVTTTPGGARISLGDGGYVAWSSTIPQCGTAAAAPVQQATQSFKATTQYIGGGSSVNIRRAPDVSAAIARSTANGTTINVVCQLAGSRLGFSQYADNRTWNRLSDGTYIHDVATTTPGGSRVPAAGGGYTAWSASIPQCSASPTTPTPTVSSAPGVAAAVAYAQRQVQGASPTAPNEDIDSIWRADGTRPGEWSGDCVRLVQLAWKHSGTSTRVLGGNTADELRRKYSVQTGAAPAGALVFWAKGGSVGSAGHVALSDGNGGVYSTLGYDGDEQPVVHVSIADLHYGAPTGWAMPPS